MEKDETSVGGPQALLIDLDNCPQEIARFGASLQDFSRIIGCYAGPEPKVGLGLVPVLAKIFETKKLELVAMNPGKNAADFGLAFWAGRLLETLPSNTEFLVLSHDKDLDRVVELLQAYGRSARRVQSESSATQKSKKVSSETRKAAQLFRNTLKPGTANPSSRKTLRNHVQAILKGKGIEIDPDRVIKALVSDGFVHINGDKKVTYHFSRPD